MASYSPSQKSVNVSFNEYEQEFNPSKFINFYKVPDMSKISIIVQHRLQCFHEAFKAVSCGVKVLDYGAGPVVLSTISASTKASEIVLGDFVSKNLLLVRKWLQEDPDAFDWTEYFRYVVETLECNHADEVAKREQQVRSVVKALVYCDINQDPPIEKGFDSLYDVVMCSLVVEGASKNRTEYRRNLARLGNLVKPGGKIFYYGVENKVGYYTIGDRNFPNIHIDHEFSLSAFEDAGFCDLTIKHAPICDPNHLFWFVQGTRNRNVDC